MAWKALEAELIGWEKRARQQLGYSDGIQATNLQLLRFLKFQPTGASYSPVNWTLTIKPDMDSVMSTAEEVNTLAQPLVDDAANTPELSAEARASDGQITPAVQSGKIPSVQVSMIPSVNLGTHTPC